MKHSSTYFIPVIPAATVAVTNQSDATRLQRRIAAWLLALVACAVAQVQAATATWTAIGGGDTNWSTGANWTGGSGGGGAQATGDGVIFTNNGLVTASTTLVNNFVDTSTSISSLWYAPTNMSGSTNLYHNTFIGSGVTLSITNNNGPVSSALFVGGMSDLVNSNNVAVNISGTNGATLVISNTGANILIAQGGTLIGTAQRATLNMSGLDTFVATVSRIGVAGRQTFSSSIPDDGCGVWFLAKTNTITVKSTPASYPSNTIVPFPFVVGDTANAGKAGFNYLYLGISNAINADGLAFGTYKSGSGGASGGAMLFNPAFTNSNPTAVFRNTNGTSRITFWSIGDQNGQGGSNQDTGTNDFSGGTVDILVDRMSLGKDHTETSGQVQRGFLAFTAGTIDVNTLIVGNQTAGTAGTGGAGLGQGPCLGVVNVNGPTANLVVNNTLDLGHTTLAVNNIPNTSGILNIRNGTVRANAIIVGAVSITNNITMTNGTLIVSNTIASPGKGLFNFATTNSTLQLNVTGVTNVVTTNLVVGGTTNIIFPANVAVFASYPKQVTLIKYVALTGTYNFGFGANVLPASAPGAYLSNNVANSSIDLVLPTDPRPSSTTPAGYSGPIADVTFSVTPSGTGNRIP